MCLIDNDYEYAIVLHERHPVARKLHKCNECYREIQPGERYMTERIVWEGAASTHKTCAHCIAVRKWLMKECGGFLYGGIYEDVSEHDGYTDKKYSIGMFRKWMKKDGTMWPAPPIGESDE